MRVLLDTHAFLWFVGADARLSSRARRTVADADDVWVSLASCWEMAIKLSVGKLRLAVPIERFLQEQLATNRIQLLHIEMAHATRVATLEWHHRDPFDRLLAAQALTDDLTVVSSDRIFRKYGVKLAW